MHYFFTKQFHEYGLGKVSYSKCKFCNLVAASTLLDLPEDEWVMLNRAYHGSYQGTGHDPVDPMWVERLNAQARVIADLTDLRLLSPDLPWVDVGCGDGKLSHLVHANYGLRLQKFDRYMNDPAYLSENDLKCKKFGFEKIPCNPDWFYLLPAHCVFFTNKSMKILFREWGFTASIYNVESRLWFWFRTGTDRVEKIIRKANELPGREILYYHFKRGFMDYWKLDKNKVLRRAH
jgi:hypothetical protein